MGLESLQLVLNALDNAAHVAEVEFKKNFEETIKHNGMWEMAAHIAGKRKGYSLTVLAELMLKTNDMRNNLRFSNSELT